MQVSTHGDLVRGLGLAGRARHDAAGRGALNRLLEGTGVTFHTTGTYTVTLAKREEGRSALPLIAVYGPTTQTLEDVTSSVGIREGEDLAKKQITNLRESFRTFANVQDADWNDAGFIIRGLNSEGLTPGGAPLASIYVDGVQQTVQGARRGQTGSGIRSRSRSTAARNPPWPAARRWRAPSM